MRKSLVAQLLFLHGLLLAGCARAENQPAMAEAATASSVTAVNAADMDVEAENRAAKPSSPTAQAVSLAKATPLKAATNGDDSAFRVMSWNLEWFFDNDPGDNFSVLAKQQTLATRKQWDWKRDAVANAIVQARPSVIGLQEIENRRVLFYLRRALAQDHNLAYHELSIEGNDFFTEQDVGMMFRSDGGTEVTESNLPMVDPIQVSMFGRSHAQRNDKTLMDVGKHLAVTFGVVYEDASEQVTVVNVHLRAKEEGSETRTRQARQIHAWLAEKIKQGESVIVMGDLNTDESTFPAQPGSDMFAILGLETPDIKDDLIDLHTQLATTERQTHLLKNKMFDRILVSQSLIADDKSRVDLVFTKMQRLRELSVQGQVDEPQQHWDHYWEIDNESRDISDHWPIMASFEWK